MYEFHELRGILLDGCLLAQFHPTWIVFHRALIALFTLKSRYDERQWGVAYFDPKKGLLTSFVLKNMAFVLYRFSYPVMGYVEIAA